jgi:hypothetical protein
MKASNVVGGLVATIVLLCAVPAFADPYVHDGFQFRGAIGPGYLSDTESYGDGSASATLSGGSASLELYFGGTPVPGLALTFGGFLTGASAPGPSISVNGTTVGTANNVSLQLGTFGPYVDFYPFPSGGFHVLGTLGFAQLSTSNSDGTTTSENGFTVGAGVGYDFWVASNWSLGVLGRLQFASAKVNNDGFTTTDNIVAPAILLSACYQ